MLLANLGVAAVAPRVAWGERPQAGSLPAIVLTRVSDTPKYVMDGTVTLSETRVQADCWALTYAGADAVAKAITAALSGFAGTVGATRFHGVFSEGARDLREAGTDDAARYFRVSIDFIIHHSEI